LFVLVLLIFISGCSEDPKLSMEGGTSKVDKVQTDYDLGLIYTDKPISNKMGWVNYNYPTGVYIDKNSGETIYYLSNESVDVFDLYPGFIVEFLDRPSIQLENEMKFEGRESSEIEREVSEYKDLLRSKHSVFIRDSESVLGRDIIVRKEFTYLVNAISLDISSYDAEKLSNLPGIKRVVKNEKVEALLMDSIPLINADDVWSNTGFTGDGIKVAIIDTGIDYNHPDLGGCFGQGCKVVRGWDIVHQDNDPIDDMGHGTHVAGIVASQDGNGVGLLGVAPGAKLYSYKVLDSGGSGYMDWVIEGVEMAVLDGVDIISMSLGGRGDPDDPISAAVDNAVYSGVVVIVSSGNSGPSYETIKSPGTARKAITVGAIYKKNYIGNYWDDINPMQGEIVRFSSRGPVIGDTFGLVKPDIVAPGAIVCSSRYDSLFPLGQHEYYFPCVDEEHIQVAGTSMAAPMVAGVAALILEAHPDWSPDEVKMALRHNANNLFSEFGYDVNTQGYGMVDALEAVLSNKPPVAYLNTSGEITGLNIPITGIARGDNFANYSLFYTLGNPHSIYNPNWMEICNSSNPVFNGELCIWDTNLLEDGEYTLKLEVNSNDKQSFDYVYISRENVRISEPFDLNDADAWNGIFPEVLPTWKSVQINGTAFIYNFDHYKIEWSGGDGWNTGGIVLNNNGLQPIDRGELGVFDVGSFDEASFYKLKLTVYDVEGNFEYDEIDIYIDPTLHEGWPIHIWEDSTGYALAFLDQPTLKDMDKDGKVDIITAYGETINVIDDIGMSLPGWPVYITDCGAIQSGPAVGDLDRDGFNEVVVGDNCGRLYVLNHDGSYLFELSSLGSRLTTPNIADLNLDGELEIVIGTYGGLLYVLDRNGNHLDGWPKDLRVEELNPPCRIDTPSSIGDVNGDEEKEIVVSCFSTVTGDPITMNTTIWVLNGDGTTVAGWPKTLVDEENIRGSNIILANIDGEEGEEIISLSPHAKKIYAWNSDGSNVDGWPSSIITNYEWSMISRSYLSVGDMDDDTRLEIFFTDWYCLYVYNSSGGFLVDLSFCAEDIDETYLWGQPSIVDLDGDRDLEIATQSYTHFPRYDLKKYYTVDYSRPDITGLYKLLDEMEFGEVVPVSDIDKDGKNELIVSTWAVTTFVWDMDG